MGMTDRTFYKSHTCIDCGIKFCGVKQQRCLVCKVREMDRVIRESKKRKYWEKKLKTLVPILSKLPTQEQDEKFREGYGL